MSTFSGSIPLFLTTLLLAGCLQAPAGMAPAADTVTLAVRPVVNGAARRLQQVVTPYTAADIEHLYLAVNKLVAGTPTPLLDAGGDPIVLHLTREPGFDVDEHAVTVGSLRTDTQYRIIATAYTGGDEDSGTPIAAAGAACETNITIGRATVGTVVETDVQVKLIDQPFAGKAHCTLVTVTPGGFVGVEPPAVDPP